MPPPLGQINEENGAPIFQISALGTSVIPPTEIARPPGSSNTKQSPSASSGKSPSPSASTKSSSDSAEIKSTQLATGESSEATSESGVLIGVASLLVIGTGLGATVYIRYKQGKPLFPLKKKPKISKVATPKKKGK
jgi:hypothetical protein